MEYSPINFRRLDFFEYHPGKFEPWYPWREKQVFNPYQSALVRNSHRGDLPRTDSVEPRSYLSYFLE